MRTAPWLQLNVATPDTVDRTPEVLDVAERLFCALRRDGVVDRFFFMRKPPGVRLRLRATARARLGVLERALLDCARALRRAGVATRAFVGCYEPETFLFGGPEAMELVHAHFHADALAFVRGARLRAAGRARLSPTLLSAAMLNDLFLSVVPGAEEAWDVWCNLATIQRPPEARRDAVVRGAGRPLPVVRLADLAPLVPRPEAAVLATYARANARLARGIERLHERGLLRARRRLILPFVAQFHFNRYGFGPAEREQICAPMVHALDPARAFAGFGAAAGPARTERTFVTRAPA